MVNEGIMAMPQGMPMQGDQPVDDRPVVSSADSYDAAQTVLQQRSPEDYAALKEAMRQNLAEVELSSSEISSLLETLVYMSQNPAEYNQLRQNLINNEIIDPEDLPEDYDPEFLGVLISLLHEMQLMQFEGAQAPMGDLPVVEGTDAMQGLDGTQPLAMARGGLADVASYMASQGRNGDTMLAHITPAEARLLMSRGGSGTINPVTGLPEFFLKKLFKGVSKVAKKVLKSPVGRILATVGLAAVLGPTSVGMTLGKAGTAALVSGGVTLLGGGSLKEALMTGAMGYFGGGGTIGGFSPTQALGSFLPGAAGSALNVGLSTGLVGAGIGKLGGLSTKDALRMGLTSGLSAAALQGLESMRAEAPANVQAQSDMGMQPSASGPQIPTAGPQVPTAGPQFDGTARSLLSMQPNQAMTFGSPNAPVATAPAASSPGFFDRLFGATAAPAAAAPAMAPGVAAAASTAPAAAAGSSSLFSGMMPKIAMGTLAAGALGGFKNKEKLDPLTEAEKARYFEDVRRAQERDKFVRGGGYGLETPMITPSNPIVNIDYSGGIPMPRNIPTIAPTGITSLPVPMAQPYNVPGMYGIPMVYGQNMALGGTPVQNFAKGGAPVPTNFPRKTGPISGPGTGTSDDIPAMLSDGEFVFTAKAVRNAGNGSRRKGAARMYKLMKMLEGGPVKGK